MCFNQASIRLAKNKDYKQKRSGEVKALALHTVNPGLIPSIEYSFLSITRSYFEHKARRKPWSLWNMSHLPPNKIKR